MTLSDLGVGFGGFGGKGEERDGDLPSSSTRNIARVILKINFEII